MRPGDLHRLIPGPAGILEAAPTARHWSARIGTADRGNDIPLCGVSRRRIWLIASIGTAAMAEVSMTRSPDHLFVLDIVKLDAPPTRGLRSFFGPGPVIAIADPDAQVKFPLRWTMFDVASVQLLTSSAAVAPLRKTYATPPRPLGYDDTTVTVPALHTSGAILQAFDACGGYLNSRQLTAYAQVSYVIDGAGRVYPIALIGDTFWMLENYQFPADGSYVYGDDPGNEAAFGRLYDARAGAQAPGGGQCRPRRTGARCSASTAMPARPARR